MVRRKSFGEKVRELIRIRTEQKSEYHEYCETPEGVAERVNALLKFFGLTPKILAEILRVSESTVKRWAKGENTSRAHRLLTVYHLEEIMAQARGTFRQDK